MSHLLSLEDTFRTGKKIAKEATAVIPKNFLCRFLVLFHLSNSAYFRYQVLHRQLCHNTPQARPWEEYVTDD